MRHRRTHRASRALTRPRTSDPRPASARLRRHLRSLRKVMVLARPLLVLLNIVAVIVRMTLDTLRDR